MRKRDIKLSAVKLRLRKTTHKHGIEAPTSIKDAERVDSKNGNRFWHDAIQLEMQNNGIAFQILGIGVNSPPG